MDEPVVFNRVLDDLEARGYDAFVHVPDSFTDRHDSILERGERHRISIAGRFPDVNILEYRWRRNRGHYNSAHKFLDMADYTAAEDVECEHVDPEFTSFENEFGEVEINLEFPEFSHVCPVTERPDNGVLEVTYIPDDMVLEEKSFRDYLYAYRHKGIWHEAAAADIKDHIVDAVDPLFVEVEIEFKARGGIYTTVRAEYDNR